MTSSSEKIELRLRLRFVSLLLMLPPRPPDVGRALSGTLGGRLFANKEEDDDEEEDEDEDEEDDFE